MSDPVGTHEFLTRFPCDYCDENFGGSHYHCGNCHDPKPTSMFGHYRNGAFTCEGVTDESVESDESE